MRNICEWRDCVAFPDCYAVSSNGDILSKRSGKLLKPKKSKAGYYYVALACHGEIKTMRIHRLVALAFMNSHNGRKKYISKDFLVFDDIMLFKGMLKAALDGAKKA